jgi:hypothetical protein
VESLADEVLGSKANNEYQLFLAKLGGTRSNQVFHFFGVEAPQHVVEVHLLEAEEKKAKKVVALAASRGAGSTGALEKKKLRGEGRLGSVEVLPHSGEDHERLPPSQ